MAIPSQTNLRSTVSVVQLDQIQRQIQQEPAKAINYQNLKTPAHIIGNFTIVPPNKIT